jgi:hypothetical protein
MFVALIGQTHHDEGLGGLEQFRLGSLEQFMGIKPLTARVLEAAGIDFTGAGE